MTEKVKVSQHQLRVLDKISQLGYESALTKQEICDAILHGYELKNKFNPGDKVVVTNTNLSQCGSVYTVEYLSTSGSIVRLECGPSLHVSDLKLATPEEIAAHERIQSESKVNRLVQELNQYEHFILREKLAKLYEGRKNDE